MFVIRGWFGKMVAFKEARMVPVPIKKAVAKLKLVPRDHPFLGMAKRLGTSFGE
jgi:hypothetical protein